jgi:hypothetical protein
MYGSYVLNNVARMAKAFSGKCFNILFLPLYLKSPQQMTGILSHV